MLKILKFQRGNSYNMGQRDGFASSDIAKINQMYKCDNAPSSGGLSPKPPSFGFPSRPTTGNGGSSGFTNPLAQVVSGIGNIFSALGKREADFEATNDLN